MKHKVVMVAACPFPANHGSPASIKEMSESLVKLGHEVHIITYPIQQDIKVVGPEIHRVNSLFIKKKKITVGPSLEKLIYDPLMVFKLIWLILSKKIDVIHAHNYEGALIGWLAKVITRRPMLYNGVNSMTDELASYDFFKSKTLAKWLAWFLDHTVPFMGDYTTVVSDSLREYLMSLGVRGDRLQVLPAGVNSAMFPPQDATQLRQKYNYAKEDKIVLYTGSLDIFQQVENLLEASALLAGKIKNLKVVLAANIAGEKDLARIREHMSRLQLENVIEIKEGVGLHELPDYLALADVATVPRTDCPGHPVKILNYMASGVAIVGFSGAAKGLFHMRSGFLVEDDNIEQFSDGIRFLLENPTVAKQLRKNAKEIQNNLYEWSTLAKGIVVIYEMLRTKDFESKQQELECYIKKSYQPRFYERRNTNGKPEEIDFPCRRKESRRKSSEVIYFVERRRIIDAE